MRNKEKVKKVFIKSLSDILIKVKDACPNIPKVLSLWEDRGQCFRDCRNVFMWTEIVQKERIRKGDVEIPKRVVTRAWS